MGRDITGEQGDCCERDRHEQERRDIKRANIVKQRGEQTSRQKSENQSNEGADSNQLRCVSHNEPQDIATLRAQGHANADLMRALDYQI